MTQPAAIVVDDATSSVRRQVRGSALLLTGRGCSILLNLVTQVLVVRALARTDYGQLAFALSIVEMLALGTAFSLDKSLSRFGAIYHEQQDRPRLAGSLVLCGVIPLGLGLLIVASLWLAPASLNQSLEINDATSRLLLLAAVLVPASAFASVTMSLLTVVHGAGAVFYRKHLLGPALKLALVGGAILNGAGSIGIVAAFVVAGACGLVTDVWLLVRLIKREGLFPYLTPRKIVIPAREVISYSIPLLISDLSYVARGTLVVVLLGWLGTAEETAAFRAVLPVVRLNELVIVNFAFMFTPLASRLFAQGKVVELWDVYRRTRTWIMALSFPIYAACVCLAAPLTITLFGEAYHDSALLLTVLSYAFFLQAMLGFNSGLLKVLGRVQTMMAIDIVVSAMTLAAVWWATIGYGALGAAIAAGGGVVLHCLLKSVALRSSVPEAADRCPDHARLGVFLVASGLAAISLTWTPGWVVGASLAAVSTVLVFWICRVKMQASSMFPELARLPGMSLLLGTGRGRAASVFVLEPNAPRPRRVAYMMSRFPKLTETFILREMIEMQRLGVEVGVYPLQRERGGVMHPEVISFVERACFTPLMSSSVLSANVRCLFRHPVNYVSTLTRVIWANLGSARYLGGALLFFPKSVLLSERMRRDRIEHVHAHFASHPAMAAWVIHRLTGIPYSFTAHGSDLHRDQHMLSEKVKDAAFTIAISEYNRRLIVDHCGPSIQDRVHVVHCGVDPQVFSRRVQASSTGASPFRVICVGTLHEVKGQSHLLRACHAIKQAGRPIVCHLIGDGPDREMLESLVGELELVDCVHFHGSRTSSEVHQLLQQVDAIVAPSVPTSDGRREGIPVVLMEGMATGLPAIASDLSGIPELVRHEVTGLLTPPGDSAAIASALMRLMDDVSLRQRLAEAGHALVSAEFNSAVNARELLRLMAASLPADGFKGRGAVNAIKVDPTFAKQREEEPCLA